MPQDGDPLHNTLAERMNNRGRPHHALDMRSDDPY